MKKIVFVMILLLVALNFYALVKLSGNIKNHVDKTIQIRMRTKKGEGIIIKAIPVDKNGNFSSEFKISNKNYYFFYTGNQYTEIYLKPDYNLRIELDYKDFDNWVKSAEGKAIPGSLDFLNYAFENGYDIYYVSNRKLRHMEGTLKNLKILGFPQAKESHILLKDDTSNKGIRRDKVAEDHFIVMLIGDNLIDFEDVFCYKNIEERFSSVEDFKNEFGNRFIILPNPMYGEWEKTLYGGTRKIPVKEKEKKLWEHLRNNK